MLERYIQYSLTRVLNNLHGGQTRWLWDRFTNHLWAHYWVLDIFCFTFYYIESTFHYIESIRSQFSHVTTAQLSWHVRNCDFLKNYFSSKSNNVSARFGLRNPVNSFCKLVVGLVLTPWTLLPAVGSLVTPGTPLPAVGIGAPVRSIEKTTGSLHLPYYSPFSIMTVPCQRSLPPYWPVWAIVPVPVFRVETKHTVFMTYPMHNWAPYWPFTMVYACVPHFNLWRGHKHPCSV